MKTYAALAASALIVAATMDSATAMKTYLEEIPNGSLFTQDLGHPDKDSSQFTKFGTAFGAADHTWTAAFCKATFPGSSMTNGEAFGDPCCTWKKGGTPDFAVAAFTTTPGKATVCASGGGGASGTGGSAPSGDSPAEKPSMSSGAEPETSSGAEPETSSGAEPETSSGAETPSTETQTSDSGSDTESPSETESSSETDSPYQTESSSETETSRETESSRPDTSESQLPTTPEAPATNTGDSNSWSTPPTSPTGSNSWSNPSTPSTGGWSPPSTGGGCAVKRKFRH